MAVPITTAHLRCCRHFPLLLVCRLLNVASWRRPPAPHWSCRPPRPPCSVATAAAAAARPLAAAPRLRRPSLPALPQSGYVWRPAAAACPAVRRSQTWQEDSKGILVYEACRQKLQSMSFQVQSTGNLWYGRCGMHASSIRKGLCRLGCSHGV